MNLKIVATWKLIAPRFAWQILFLRIWL